ncbi:MULTISPECIES: hypothetical protein [Sulfolobaceae]|uniref:hypothetical protein n=1 Tax=Sulfolobaceae TaxID=118883 RepID=UPI001EE7B8C8|nr:MULTISPECIES: hypothetical protein [unclassified Sulfolobus]
MFSLVLLLLLFPHAFVEYSVNVHILSSNQFLNEILLEEVNDTYPNGTFQYSVIVYVMNFSEMFPPGVNYDNLSYPKTFFYIPNVSKPVIDRQVVLVLVNYSNGYYIYIMVFLI